VHPQTGLVDAEEREGLIDDVAEQPVEILAATHLRHDPAQGVGSDRWVGAGCGRRLFAGSLMCDDHRCGAVLHS